MRIREWYDYWDGQVYVSFSGGKDSTVLRDIVKSISPDVPAVFVDTGLEYPGVRDFATKYADEIVRPDIRFDEVIKKYGYPVISKQQARGIRDLQNASEKNKATCNLRITGYNRKGVYCSSQKVSDKWQYLKDAPFKISEQCCDIMKKRPMHKYAKETGRHPITGVMACESQGREKIYLKSGCNAFNAKEPISHPLSIWTEQDILHYIQKNNLDYADVYGDIVLNDKTMNLTTTGENRTGCMFCMFGVHLEEHPNRFERMKETHPKQYEYCIKNLGLGGIRIYRGFI